jgi:hypothetical protein
MSIPCENSRDMFGMKKIKVRKKYLVTGLFIDPGLLL